MDFDAAEQLLTDQYGLQVVRQDGSCLRPPDTVCNQDPLPGTEVQDGDTATLFVQP